MRSRGFSIVGLTHLGVEVAVAAPWAATILGILLAASRPATGEIQELDLLAPSDGLLTRDTATNLEWLDLTATTNTSWAEIDSDAGGWLSLGFRRATGPEVCELFRNMGFVSEPCPVRYPGLSTPLRFPASGELVELHLARLGVTWSPASTMVTESYAIGWFDDGTLSPFVHGQATVHRQVFSNVAIDRARADVWTSVFVPGFDPNFKVSTTGHFLVRPGPTACNDGEDNDGDGRIDAGGDPGCEGAFDGSETSPEFGCDDGIDNDGDGGTDAAGDPGCSRPDEPFEDSEDPAAQHVLILHSGGPAPIEPLLATGRFRSVEEFRIDQLAAAPEPRIAFDYDAILCYTVSAPRDPEVLGDFLADFVDSGGRLLLTTFAFSPPWSVRGRITDPGYSPFVDVGVNGPVSGALFPTRPRHPVFDGVDPEAVVFGSNANYAHPALDAEATLLATDGAGTAMLALNAPGTVRALNVAPLVAPSNQVPFYALVANLLLPIPVVQTARIEVAPFGRYTRIVTGSKRPFFVAWFGSEALPVSGIDAASIAFGPGAAAPLSSFGLTPEPRSRDLDEDGYGDLVFAFRSVDAGLVVGEQEACLAGEVDGVGFEGCALVEGVSGPGARSVGPSSPSAPALAP